MRDHFVGVRTGNAILQNYVGEIMARGESEADEGKGTAIAIWAVFGVACLAVAWVVVRVSIDDHPAPPAHSTTALHSALQILGTRRCGVGPLMGPHMPGGAGDSGGSNLHVTHEAIRARGYVEVELADAQRALPFVIDAAAFGGDCGLVGLTRVGEEEGLLSARAAGGGQVDPCRVEERWVPTCGAPVEADGVGQVHVSLFAMRGVTAIEGVDPELVLGQAEAQYLLAAFGWEPVEEAILVGRTGDTLHPLPSLGPSCVPYVVTGVGIGGARTSWRKGAQMGQDDDAPDRFMLGAVACPGGETSQLMMHSPPSDESFQAIARPYRRPDSGARVRNVQTTPVPLRIVDIGMLPVPDPIE